MRNRKPARKKEIRASISFMTAFGVVLLLTNILIYCPECESTEINRNGTRPREHGRVAAFICTNQDCLAKRGKKTGRQFTVLTSGEIVKLVEREISEIIDALYRRGAKAKTIASAHGVSDALVSTLKSAVDRTITRGLHRDKLVPQKTTDTAVSIDETFFKIDNETIYAIIARGYRTSKVLGINVSKTRAEADIRKAFDEAQANTSGRINVITTDAHGATRAMAMHLGYPVTAIVHPHKKPYKKAIIERIDYDGTDRVVTQIGVKVDVFKKRAKREYKYRQTRKSTIPPVKRPRGRPKGSKNKKKSKNTPPKSPKKRGRPSIFEVFKSGKKGYMKIRPQFKSIKFLGKPLGPVMTGLSDAFSIFAGMHIQNNKAETVNNVIRAVMPLGGQRTLEQLDGRLRAIGRMRNDPSLDPTSQLHHRYNARVYLKRFAGSDFRHDFSNCNITLCAQA